MKQWDEKPEREETNNLEWITIVGVLFWVMLIIIIVYVFW